MRRAVAICGVLLVAGAATGWLAVNRDRPVTAAPASTLPPTWHQGPIRSYGSIPEPLPPSRPPRALDQVREALATAYYRHVSPRLLVRPTISSILDGLGDPHTEYLSPTSYAMIQERLSRQYHGVGLTVSPAEDGLIVTSSLTGPAREAGIKPGDVIISIDGRQAATLEFDRAVSLIGGEAGTTVSLTVRRPGEDGPIEFRVVRERLSKAAVRSRLIPTSGRNIGYIRLLSFSENADEHVRDATAELVSAGADALVVDLRGNPGGLLAQAIQVASVYLDSGVVCSTEGVNQEARIYSVGSDPVETELPIAVLVDDGTASAAEIAAAALRDNKRAVIVGSKTYGKATVQSFFPLSNGGALRLTTATYLTPAGKSIGGRGIKPKVKAVDNPRTRRDEALLAAERFLVQRFRDD
jgi:carboxyl-terminal processing protease